MKVLVDYDGVILKSHRLNMLVQHRCEQYVKAITGIHDPYALAVLNKHLYMTHGHTVAGLQTLGYNAASMERFNRCVYNDLDYAKLNVLDDDIDLRALEKLAAIDDAFIFSNAPSRWVIGTISAHKYAARFLEGLKFVQVSHEAIKPQLHAYIDAKRQMRAGLTEAIFLIDDNFLNIQAGVQIKNWHGMWVSGHNFNVSDHITSVTDLTSAIYQIDMYKKIWKL